MKTTAITSEKDYTLVTDIIARGVPEWLALSRFQGMACHDSVLHVRGRVDNAGGVIRNNGSKLLSAAIVSMRRRFGVEGAA